jgi:hypothetical protein
MTTDHQLAALDRLLDLVDNLTEQMRSVIVDCDQNDWEPLRDGVVTIEVGARHLVDEIERARGRLVRTT